MALVERAAPLGGGGISLNFEVVGGTTEPTNPKENTIWVNTSLEITGWAFDSDYPLVSAGGVWIKTGTSSGAEFNALKKNAIQVFPVGCYQWDGSSWVAKTAKVYRNGSWASVFVILLGMSQNLLGVPSWVHGGGTNLESYNFGFSGSNYRIYLDSGMWGNGYVRFPTIFNNSYGRTLYLDYSVTNTGTEGTATINLNLNGNSSGGSTAATYRLADITTSAPNVSRRTISIDISSISSFYVEVYAGYGSYELLTITVHNMWVE